MKNKKAILLHDEDHPYLTKSKKDILPRFKIKHIIYKLLTNGILYFCLIYFPLSSLLDPNSHIIHLVLWAIFGLIAGIFIVFFNKEVLRLGYKDRLESYAEILILPITMIITPIAFIAFLTKDKDNGVYTSYKNFVYKNKTFSFIKGTECIQINPGILMKVWMFIFRRPAPGSKEDDQMNLILGELKERPNSSALKLPKTLQSLKNLELDRIIEDQLKGLDEENQNVTKESLMTRIQGDLGDKFLKNNPELINSLESKVKEKLIAYA